MTPTQFALLGGAFLLLLLLAPVIARLLSRAFGLRRPLAPSTRPAYAAVGLTPLLVAGVFYGALMSSGASLGMTHAPAFLLVALLCGLSGLLEDLTAGPDRRPPGWAPALATLAGAGAGVGAAYLLNRGASPSPAVALDAALIALGAPAVWALNGRPGRAVLSFSLLFVLPALVATGLALRFARLTAPTPLPDDLLWSTPPAVLLGPVVLAVALEWWPEARGKSALGSAGARLLGGLGGLGAALSLPLWGKIGLLVLLLGLALLGRERIEVGIKRGGWLRALDGASGIR